MHKHDFMGGTASLREFVRSLLVGAALALALWVPSALAVDQGPTGERPKGGDRAEPQRVAVSSFQAFDAGGRVLVRWATSLEMGAVGFDLLREADGQWVKVNEGLVPAVGEGVGGRYQVLDTHAQAPGPHRYRLMVTLHSGRSAELKTDRLKATEQIDPATVAPRRSQPRIAPAVVEPPPPSGRVGLAGPPSPIVLPGGTAAVKILTTAQGMHFLSVTNLATVLGYPSDQVSVVQGWIDNGQIALSNKGQPVNFIPGNGRVALNKLGPGLFFYAEGYMDNYTAVNVYWLRGGGNSFTSVDGQNPDPVSPGPYAAVFKAEYNEYPGLSVVQDPEADYWFWVSLMANSPPDDALTTPFPLDHLVRTPGTTATLKVQLYGGSLTDHRIEVTLNGNLLGTHDWSGLAPTEAQFTFDATLSANLKDSAAGEGDNTLTIKAVLKPGVLVSGVWMDKYSLDYQRTYFAQVGSQEAGANGNATVTVPNFTSAAAAGSVILAFDVTNVRGIKQIANLRIGAVAPRDASFNPESPAMRFAMLQPVFNGAAQIVDPSKMSVVYPVNLSDPATRASYVAIAPVGLTNIAQQLANYRSPKLRTKVVLVDDIYNEFSYGLVTPHAISGFIQTAYTQWAIRPRYVALVGDGTWDYRNKYAFGDNLIPPLMTYTPYGLFTSDLLFGKVMADGLPRVIVGRLPVTSAAAFTAVFAKIQSYEAQEKKPLKALLVAGQPDAAGDFIANIQAVEGYLAPTYTSQLVHPDYAPAPVDYPALRTEIQTALNGGVDVLNYVGHGAIDLFGTGLTSYFMDVTQPQTLDPVLANGARLPIAVAMTCVAGQYSSPGFTSLGEGLLRQSGAGAVAVIAPTGLSQDDEASLINRRFMELLGCNISGRLGDIFMQAASLYTADAVRLTPVWIYNILGDPALELTAP